MKAVVKGHLYRLDNFETDSYQELGFIQKVKGKDDELVTVSAGTTNEEVFEMLIDRLKYLDDKFPCYENKEAINYAQKAVNALYRRTEDRKLREVEGKHLN